ncbi:MAG: hypothetical protein GXP30_10260 [Verrucomicrobia bacterium]|nr:hypothetical protein [Verrucomicrobiota bacterium]
MSHPAFAAHLKASTLSGSNKGTSYLRALDLLQEMLAAHSLGFDDCRDLWQVTSVKRLHTLQKQVREEQQAGDTSVWNLDGLPKSYLQNGYCSAALTSYVAFLIELQYSSNLLEAFDSHQGSEEAVVEKLDQQLIYPESLLEDLTPAEGKEVVREVKTRVNQKVFRDIILQIYDQRCCLTGLDVPEVNRASHIIPWAEDKSIRLDPRNGLCLSATYDAAFDRHLITLDDDFRIVLSKDLKDHYSSDSFQEHFLRKEGERIQLPKAYHPKQAYLESHRASGDF